MPTRLNSQGLDALLASLGAVKEETRKYFEHSWQRHVEFLERKAIGSPEDLVDGAFNRIAQEIANGRVSRLNVATSLLTEIFKIAFPREAQDSPTEPLSTASPVPLDGLRQYLQTHFPALYAQVLASTLADLRYEHSTALGAGDPVKARWIILQGCGALLKAAIWQLGYSLLGRIASLWQARSPK
jgi:hypothetical protein